MSDEQRRILELSEYTPRAFPRDAIPEAVGDLLEQNYHDQVAVEFPRRKTGDQWILTAQGWVGYIPLSSELGIALRPKVALRNLFGMLEYAYRLKSFRFLDDTFDCSTLEEFYEYLASILGRRVLDRSRKGLYRAYLSESAALPYVRGRLDVRRVAQTPWSVNLICEYEEHTPDIEDNQILTWTLATILRSGLCTARVLPAVRQAYRVLQGTVTATPVLPSVCVGRQYNRLNQDYHALHALCRFFLEHSGPSHESGDHTMLPFLVDMARLYELFVAEWLKAHLPPNLYLHAQEKVAIEQGRDLHFTIDLALYDSATGAGLAILDTKYKVAPKPNGAMC